MVTQFLSYLCYFCVLDCPFACTLCKDCNSAVKQACEHARYEVHCQTRYFVYYCVWSITLGASFLYISRSLFICFVFMLSEMERSLLITPQPWRKCLLRFKTRHFLVSSVTQTELSYFPVCRKFWGLVIFVSLPAFLSPAWSCCASWDTHRPFWMNIESTTLLTRVRYSLAIFRIDSFSVILNS